MNKNLVSIVMYTTNGNEEEEREVYEEELNELGYTEDEFPYDEWKINEDNSRWDDMMHGIESSTYNTRCVILGTIGLWNGTHEIVPYVCVNLKEAINKCVSSADDIEITLKDGVIHVTTSHHDGTNKFDIHVLNKRGSKLIYGNFANKVYHKLIRGYLY